MTSKLIGVTEHGDKVYETDEATADRLAWCYLTAAMAACRPGAQAGDINAFTARFTELTGIEAPRFDAFSDVGIAIAELLHIAERFAERGRQ
jgi:hypothetical protein